MFTVGQKVVALYCFPEYKIKEGDVFPVFDIDFCCEQLIDIGFGLPANYECINCDSCNKNILGNKIFFYAKHFAPIEEYEAMNEFFNKITEPETMEVSKV